VAVIDDAALQGAVKASADLVGKNLKGRIGFASSPLSDKQKFNPAYWKQLDAATASGASIRRTSCPTSPSTTSSTTR